MNGITYHAENADKAWSAFRDEYTATFELRAGDTMAGDDPGVERSEFADFANLPYDTDIWVSYWMKVTATVIDAPWSVLSQFRHWADGPEEEGRSPVWAVEMYGAGGGATELRIVTRSDPNPTTVGNPPAVTRYSNTGFVLGQWYRYVHRIRLARTGDGLLQAWQDGVEVIPATALPVGYNDILGPKWKFGAYRAAGSSQPVIVKFANIEMGTSSLLDRVSNPLPLPDDA